MDYLIVSKLPSSLSNLDMTKFDRFNINSKLTIINFVLTNRYKIITLLSDSQWNSMDANDTGRVCLAHLEGGLPISSSGHLSAEMNTYLALRS